MDEKTDPVDVVGQIVGQLKCTFCGWSGEISGPTKLRDRLGEFGNRVFCPNCMKRRDELGLPPERTCSVVIEVLQ